MPGEGFLPHGVTQNAITDSTDAIYIDFIFEKNAISDRYQLSDRNKK